MAEIKLISECFVKPKYEVEAAKQPYHLSPIEVAMLSIHPIQKGLLFTLNNHPSTDERTKVISHLLDNLKHSISIALVHFYPLAGRMATTKYVEDQACTIYVDCTKGPGARLIHAGTTAPEVTTSDIICSSTDIPAIVQSMFDLGEKSVNFDGHTRALLSVQVTELQDGLFIGFTMNHSVVDGTSFIHFVSMLSEIFNSEDNTTTKISRIPIYNCKPWVDSATDKKDLSVLKLPHLEPEKLIVHTYDSYKIRERIFHFSAKTMATLKAKANKERGTIQSVVSSFQALSALVWRSITRARNLASDELTTCSVLINARSRLNPPLTEDYFGNYIWGAKLDCNVGDLVMSNDLGWVATKLREGILAQDEKAILDFYKQFAESPMIMPPGENSEESKSIHGTNRVIIGGSAWFNMYGPEFRLGRALATRMGFGNKEDGKVTANPGCEGGGSVDLEICLKPHYMAALVADSEFMSFVSL